MLGETANIRSNNIPYFQIFIIPDHIPYYNKDGGIENWESFSDRNVHKYRVLSEDLVEASIHTPNKTLLYVVKLPTISRIITQKNDYIDYYQSIANLEIKTTETSYGEFSDNIVFNDYETFIKKLIHRIESI